MSDNTVIKNTKIINPKIYAYKLPRMFDDENRLAHRLKHRVYGFAPTEIIYDIALNFIFSFDEKAKNISDSHTVLLDTTPFARGKGDFEAIVNELFGESL